MVIVSIDYDYYPQYSLIFIISKESGKIRSLDNYSKTCITIKEK